MRNKEQKDLLSIVEDSPRILLIIVGFIVVIILSLTLFILKQELHAVREPFETTAILKSVEEVESLKMKLEFEFPDGSVKETIATANKSDFLPYVDEQFYISGDYYKRSLLPKKVYINDYRPQNPKEKETKEKKEEKSKNK